MGSDRSLVVELIEIVEDHASKPERDEYGLEWKRFLRHLRPLHFLENDKVVELPPSLQHIIIEQPAKLCISPEYRWHFTTSVEGRRIILTLSARRSKMLKQGALRLIPEERGG